MIAVLISQSITSVGGHAAQSSTPSFGDYGYTYNIKPPGQPISQYNIFGEVKYGSGGSYGASKFQTYAVHQLGPTISTFETLRLRGRVWYQGETGCPLMLVADRKLNWINASGTKDVHILSINNPIPNYPKYAVGSHQLVHPYSENLQGATPSAFRVWTYDSQNPATSAIWNGVYFGC